MTTINLATLSTAEGFALIGPAANSRSGASVGNAGDLNGDGFDDLFVGGWNEVSGAGGVHVVYGQAGGLTGPLTLGTLSAAQGFTLYGGSVGDRVGASAAGIGDVTGDGRDDLLVGLYGANSFAGAAVVVFGQAGNITGPLSTSTLTAGQGARFDSGATPGAFAGFQSAPLGDINSDGVGDFIVGVSERAGGAGGAYVVYGGASAMGPFSGFTLETMPVSEGFRLDGDGAPSRIRAGTSATGIGDFNADGIDDFAVGAPGGDGAVFVVYGQAGTRPTLALGGLTSAEGFRIDGGFNWQAGVSLSAAGDVNADGIDDLILGADGANNIDGAAFVIYGVAGGISGPLDLTTLTAAQGFAMNGDASFYGTGRAVAGVGDVNGDGIDDVAVGSLGPSSTQPGTVSIIYGMAGARGAVALGALTDAEGFTVVGPANVASAGASLAAAGDVNQDGLADIILGAPGANANAGGAYVIYGFATSDTCIGTAAPDTCTGAGGDDLLVGLGGGDTLTGNGGEDTALGGAGHDLLDGGAGDDLLDGDLGNDTLLGGAGADVMKGGKGNDTYEVDEAGDLVIEMPGQGIDTVLVSFTTTLTINLENLTLTGTAAINGTGNAADNILLGNAGNNLLKGAAGRDTLDGGAGADTLEGGLGDDTYVVDSGADVVKELLNQGTDLILASLSYSLLPRPQVEQLTLTGSGNTTATGNSLANLLIGNAGDNLVSGGNGADTLDGGAGRDTLLGGAGADMFRFTGPTGAGHDDRVNDFLSGTDQVSVSLASIDPGLTSGVTVGALAGQTGRFSVGVASGAQAQFVLAANDRLFWDSNGNAAGGSTLLMDFTTGVAATDIFIIA